MDEIERRPVSLDASPSITTVYLLRGTIGSIASRSLALIALGLFAVEENLDARIISRL